MYEYETDYWSVFINIVSEKLFHTVKSQWRVCRIKNSCSRFFGFLVKLRMWFGVDHDRKWSVLKSGLYWKHSVLQIKQPIRCRNHVTCRSCDQMYRLPRDQVSLTDSSKLFWSPAALCCSATSTTVFNLSFIYFTGFILLYICHSDDDDADYEVCVDEEVWILPVFCVFNKLIQDDCFWRVSYFQGNQFRESRGDKSVNMDAQQGAQGLSGGHVQR